MASPVTTVTILLCFLLTPSNDGEFVNDGHAGSSSTVTTHRGVAFNIAKEPRRGINCIERNGYKECKIKITYGLVIGLSVFWNKNIIGGESEAPGNCSS